VLGVSHLTPKGEELFSPSLVKYLTVTLGTIVSFYFAATTVSQIANKNK